jgi:cytoskeletal protein CcmA (bactofilin family)
MSSRTELRIVAMSQLRRIFLTLAVAALALPAATYAQLRDVVAKEVSVGRDEATLHLEFSNGDALEISFDDGTVLLDGEAIGSFEPGGELDAAWRDLLSRAVALDDGPLSRMLDDWTVPADLAAELADIAQEIDQALEDALGESSVRVASDGGATSVTVNGGSLAEVLIRSLGRMGALEEALSGIDGDLRIHIDEDVVIPEGTVVRGTVVAIGGVTRVDGEIDGDLVVVAGDVELGEDSRVTGELRLAEARVVRNEGEVGRVVDVVEEQEDSESELRDRIREELERELRGEVREEVRREIRSEMRQGEESFSLLAPFRPVARAVGGVAEKLVAILLLALFGAGVLAFAGDNVDVIAETARRSPGRSAMVGFAGTILLLPVWILGTVALAVSIIFIPVAIAWLPLFPLAACLAALIGYLAVARNAGEWLADSQYPWTGWIRKSNSWVTMLGGLVGLMFAFIAANVVSIAPFLGFLSGLLVFAGVVITVIAVHVGFGAVLLTRAGRRRESWSAYDPDAAWEEAMNVDIDVELDPTPSRTKDDGATRPEGEEEEER